MRDSARPAIFSPAGTPSRHLWCTSSPRISEEPGSMRKEWDVTTMAYRFTAACTGTSGEFINFNYFYGTNVTLLYCTVINIARHK